MSRVRRRCKWEIHCCNFSVVCQHGWGVGTDSTTPSVLFNNAQFGICGLQWPRLHRPSFEGCGAWIETQLLFFLFYTFFFVKTWQYFTLNATQPPVRDSGMPRAASFKQRSGEGNGKSDNLTSFFTLTDFSHFQICSLQLQPTTIEAIYQISFSSLWSCKRLYITCCSLPQAL